MSNSPSGLRVLVDGSALSDARRTAGIGRYVSSLAGALEVLDGAEVRLVQPAQAPFSESWPVRFINAQPAIWAAARRWRPTLVHAPASDPALLWPLDRQVVTLHDLIPWTGSGFRRFRPTRTYLAYQRGRFKSCAAVIAVSPSVGDEAIDLLGLDSTRVHVVPEGVAPVFTAAPGPDDGRLRAAAGIPGEPYVVWVGSLRAMDPRKAIDILLSAVASLDDAAPHLVMVGATGTESERVAGVARELGVRTTFTGYVSDEALTAVYRGAGAAVIPSLHEGFGLPAIEALACGAPLIVSRGGNLETLVGNAAVLVAPGSSEELAAAIGRVLSDPALQGSLRAAGPTVAAPFSWERTAENTLEVYRRAATLRTPG